MDFTLKPSQEDEVGQRGSIYIYTVTKNLKKFKEHRTITSVGRDGSYGISEIYTYKVYITNKSYLFNNIYFWNMYFFRQRYDYRKFPEI